MHEASLMAGLMRQVAATAAAEGATRVVAVAVRLGALSHMTPAHFTEHFETAAAGTIAEGAALRIAACTDRTAPWAQDVLLESIEVED